jgi:HAD superfamily hydrolase (TIGR01509 family)
VIEAILWDNDGVLVDTEHLYFEATRAALGSLGVAMTLDQYREISLRQGRSCFDLARDEGASESDIRRVRDQRDRSYHARMREGVPLLDGVLQTLSALYGRLPMAIVTTTDTSNFDAIHRPHDTHRFFDFILASGMYEHSKPHPAPYLTAAEKLRLPPEACLVVEDSERGLEAATRAGMKCLVIPHALTHESDFGAAYRVLSSVRDVPQEVELLAAR